MPEARLSAQFADDDLTSRLRELEEELDELRGERDQLNEQISDLQFAMEEVRTAVVSFNPRLLLLDRHFEFF